MHFWRDGRLSAGPMAVELAESITAVVGLSEAITSKQRAIRYTWTVLFAIGIGLTMYYIYDTVAEYMSSPTATNVSDLCPSPQGTAKKTPRFQVQLMSELDYDFPPLLLCPSAWFDAEKAYSMGLSTEALKYSLSYLDNWFVNTFENIEEARLEFSNFYKARKYRSLLEYFTDISQDLRPKAAMNGSSTSWYECRGCHPDMMSGAVERTILSTRFCYIFRLKPIEHGFGMYSGVRAVEIKYQSKTDGLVEDSDNWELYFSPRLDIFVTVHPSLTVKAFHKNTVKLNAQKFITLSNNKSVCSASPHGDESYSSVKCMTTCHNALYHRTIGCGLLWLKGSHLEMTPDLTCNRAYTLPPNNWTLEKFLGTKLNERIDAEAANDCVEQCPRKCSRIIYDTILQVQQNYLASEKKAAKEANASLIQVYLRHGNVYQGGMVVSEEIYIYSFTQLLNNIGGTLGLFVGATLMTLVQLLLFCVRYLWSLKSMGKVPG